MPELPITAHVVRCEACDTPGEVIDGRLPSGWMCLGRWRWPLCPTCVARHGHKFSELSR